ncbi:WD40/YVTN/BNR-like repeat-containing protein [Microscilla marina]|nr:glycosyl hydrolase [Microscilla marina]
MNKRYPIKWNLLCIMWVLSLGIITTAEAQRKKKKNNKNTPESTVKQYFKSMKWRNIGPNRGGRAAAVTGVPGKPDLYYMGVTGGGVWKTNDAGTTWKNISDGFFGGSIGAIAVSEYDNNVIYVGGGETTVRGNVSHGDGVWKSVDGGKTWKHMGLKESRHIGRISIHPKNPDIVYVAALGHLFGPHPARGVYRSMNGGNTWKKILFANENAGAFDLILDPNNPRVVYASTWRVRRTPYSLESGGKGSVLWKSTDGGDNWINLHKKSQGLPKGLLGVIGVTVSPVNSNRVWAIIEHKNGGVFRSDNAGKTWIKVNSERKLRQRAWYYSRIYADTKDLDMVYVVNVRFHRSKDGGKTYQSIKTPHGDHHDLWISPDNNQHLIVADDGGAQVSKNHGASWSTYMNQPTAQFYRVSVDNHYPYRLYAGQQDNSAIRILSTARPGNIRAWESTAGGESGHIVADPTNNDIVYGGSYDGFLIKMNHKTKQFKSVDVYPDNPMGWGAKDLKYRFQWNFPIFFSPHDAKTLYTAAQVLFKTTDGGHSWTKISGDLTRNDTTKMKSSGGPITKDNTSVEYYGTIFAACESPYEKGLLWAGSDDGLMHVSRDGGKTWKNVTPKGMPEWVMINSVEPHPTIKGGCYIAGTRYKLDDFKPYLYVTTNYGKTWKKITNGIKDNHFTRVLRADPKRKGLLYAGTEYGVYMSLDDGANWKSLQLNLPQVPITDLAIKNNDLIAATQGRAFWILDDLTPLHQFNDEVKKSTAYLFKPNSTYSGGASRGVSIRYYLKDKPGKDQPVTLELMDGNGKLIAKYTTQKNKSKKPRKENGVTVRKLKVKKGSNSFRWNMRYEGAERFKGMVLWFGGTKGPKAVPGKYKVHLTAAGKTQTQEFEIVKDPRIEASQADLEAQFKFLVEVRDKLTETHQAIKQIRKMKKDIGGVMARLGDNDKMKDVKEMGKAMIKKISTIEKALYQTQNRSPQDPLNYPIRLNNKLSTLATYAGFADSRPTRGLVQVKKDLTAKINVQLNKLKGVISQDVPKFNNLVAQKQIPAIMITDEAKE